MSRNNSNGGSSQPSETSKTLDDDNAASGASRTTSSHYAAVQGRRRYSTFNSDDGDVPVSRIRAHTMIQPQDRRPSVNRSRNRTYSTYSTGAATRHNGFNGITCNSSIGSSTTLLPGAAFAAKLPSRYRTYSTTSSRYRNIGDPRYGEQDNTETTKLIDNYEECEISNEDNVRVELKKSLTLLDGIGVIVGIMIGAGIFVSPKGVVQYSGSVGMALVVWAVSGLLSLVGAICYAELGTMIPKSGGDYIYIYEAFGGLPGFLYIWGSLVIIQPTGNTVMALAFANYIIEPLFKGTQVPEVAISLIALLVILFLTYLNSVSIRGSLKVQDMLGLTKVGALLTIIGVGAWHLGQGNTHNFDNAFHGTNWNVFSLATAFYQGLFSFAGWNCLNFVVEELIDPYKNLPRAILISMPVICSIYFFTNVAYFAVLTKEEIMSSDAVAVSFGSSTLGVMSWTMPLFVACATFSSLNGCVFSGSRLLYASAREGHLPEPLSLISIKYFTPIPALIVMLMTTMLYMITSDIQVLINLVSFAESLFITASIAALLWLRYKQPDRPRPIKVWIVFPVLFFLICLFLDIFPVFERPQELCTAYAMVLSGIPVYYIGMKTKNSNACNGILSRLTRVCQILVEGMPEDSSIQEENGQFNES
ncbi:unnamed protein product [Meganyctiphanes norvegica]|uniref:Y+L amino acid transporter 2 n=1 Tax=Meganyctiphanes norvegica TaxID=48144 RepID=A0AAV2QCJ0_MEGNR